jgi:hypothetical protein
VSQLWLPKVICDKLAESLGLTFDSSTELYLVNDTIRTKLLDLAPEFTFTLAANATSSDTVNIVLPYAAFDLTVSQPFYNTSRHYFPIRRAADEKLYVYARGISGDRLGARQFQRESSATSSHGKRYCAHTSGQQ